jgi:hypothetical protein
MAASRLLRLFEPVGRLSAMTNGLWSRRRSAAIGLGIVCVGPGEALVGGAIDAARPWLPAALLGAVAQGGTAEIAYGHAVVVLSVYGIVAAVLCALLFRRRDVAA